MSEKEIKFEYKCRRCGVSFLVDSDIEDEDRAIKIMFGSLTGDTEGYQIEEEEEVINLFRRHRCYGGGVGLADIVGFDIVLLD